MLKWTRKRTTRLAAALSAAAIALLPGVLPVYAADGHRPAAVSEDDGSSSAIPTGTAVLAGAGAYTYVRIKRKEKKNEQKYEYFENHTQNGTLREEEKWHQG